MFYQMKNMKTVFAAAILCVAVGCQTIGPRSLRTTHPQYNHAISQTLDEQFLLNLVRLKYRDNPFFLEVSSVTTQQSVETEMSASVKFLRGGDTLTPSTGMTYKETPTISYAPLRGDQFLKQILSPVPLEAVLILTQSGWSVERVVSICVERVNGLDNASNASGPTPAREPRFEKFQEMVGILRELQLADALELGAAPCLADTDGKMRSGNDLVLRLRLVAALAPRIVLMVRQHGCYQAMHGKQFSGDAGVFAGNHVGAGQNGKCAGRDIGSIADRRCDENEARRRGPGGRFTLPATIARLRRGGTGGQ